MTVAAAVLATLVLVLLAGAVGGWRAFRRRELEHGADVQLDQAAADRLLDSLYVERVVVTMKNGSREEAFEGLLADVDPRSVVLRDVQALTDSGRRAVDGELLLPRDGIAYIQRPGA